jgi:hypothetical protein
MSSSYPTGLTAPVPSRALLCRPCKGQAGPGHCRRRAWSPIWSLVAYLEPCPLPRALSPTSRRSSPRTVRSGRSRSTVVAHAAWSRAALQSRFVRSRQTGRNIQFQRSGPGASAARTYDSMGSTLSIVAPGARDAPGAAARARARATFPSPTTHRPPETRVAICVSRLLVLLGGPKSGRCDKFQAAKPRRAFMT